MFITIFLLVLYLVFQDRLAIYLKEPKPKFSLSEKGLSRAEIHYAMSAAKGRSPREIADDFEVSEPTVRNALSRAFAKLSVEDELALAALAEKYEMVDQGGADR